MTINIEASRSLLNVPDYSYNPGTSEWTPGSPDSWSLPFGIPAICCLPNGNILVAVEIETNMKTYTDTIPLSQCKLYLLRPDLSTISEKVLISHNVELGPPDVYTYGRPYMKRLEDHTVILIWGADHNKGRSFLLDCSSTDIRVLSDTALLSQITFWSANHGNSVFLRDLQILVLANDQGLHTFKHGIHLQTHLWVAIPEISYKKSVGYLWISKNNRHRVMGSSYGVTKEFEISPSGDISYLGAVQNNPSNGINYEMYAGSYYDSDRVILQQLQDGDLSTYSLTEGVAPYTPLVGTDPDTLYTLGDELCGLTVGDKRFISYMNVEKDSDSVYEYGNFLSAVDYAVDPPYFSHLFIPTIQVTPSGNPHYSGLNAGSNAIDYLNDTIVTAACSVNGERSDLIDPRYYGLEIRRYSIDWNTKTKIKDNEGNWRRIGEGDTPQHGSLKVKLSTGWAREVRTGDEDQPMKPLYVKTSDGWEVMTMMTEKPDPSGF